MPQFRYRRHHGWFAVFFACLSVLLFVAQSNGWLKDAADKSASIQPGAYSVTRFVDGDTIVVNMNGRSEKIRFIGVDTPETHKPNTPVQCYGPAASAFTKNSIGMAHVRLVSDPLSSNRDRYDRLLRYVYLPDGRLLNQELIRHGYGFYYPYFPFSKFREFSESQKLAQAGHRGLWGECQPKHTDGGGYVSNDLPG